MLNPFSSSLAWFRVPPPIRRDANTKQLKSRLTMQA
jgi:hypothetical protein